MTPTCQSTAPMSTPTPSTSTQQNSIRIMTPRKCNTPKKASHTMIQDAIEKVSTLKTNYTLSNINTYDIHVHSCSSTSRVSQAIGKTAKIAKLIIRELIISEFYIKKILLILARQPCQPCLISLMIG